MHIGHHAHAKYNGAPCTPRNPEHTVYSSRHTKSHAHATGHRAPWTHCLEAGQRHAHTAAERGPAPRPSRRLRLLLTPPLRPPGRPPPWLRGLRPSLPGVSLARALLCQVYSGSHAGLAPGGKNWRCRGRRSSAWRGPANAAARTYRTYRVFTPSCGRSGARREAGHRCLPGSRRPAWPAGKSATPCGWCRSQGASSVAPSPHFRKVRPAAQSAPTPAFPWSCPAVPAREPPVHLGLAHVEATSLLAHQVLARIVPRAGCWSETSVAQSGPALEERRC